MNICVNVDRIDLKLIELWEGIGIQLDYYRMDEADRQRFDSDVDGIVSEYNIKAIHLPALFDFRRLKEHNALDKYGYLEETDVPLVLHMPINKKNISEDKKLRLEYNAVKYLREHPNVCVETFISPHRIINLTGTIKWKLPICLDVCHCDFVQANWLMINRPEQIKVIHISGNSHDPIAWGEFNFLCRFKNIIESNNIPVVFEYMDMNVAFHDAKIVRKVFNRFKEK